MWNEIFCTKLQLPPEPLTRGLLPPDPRFLCPLSSTEFIEPPLQTEFLGMPLDLKDHSTFMQSIPFKMNVGHRSHDDMASHSRRLRSS